ncbi:MAG: dioxygenase [Rickettsiales bacterium]|nr:MAG: dioxygenase [Rickettsiales bacterium]
MSKFKLLLISLLLSSPTIFAHIGTPLHLAHLNNLNYCTLTPETVNEYAPERFESTNNLLRKSGQRALYCGEKIIIHGIVLDQNCAPVSDAKIHAWQVDCMGKYSYQPLKTRIDQKLININPDSTFTGNGTAMTNNKGKFHFVTTYPRAVHGRASHINIKIQHRMLGALETRLTLKGKRVRHPSKIPELDSISEIAEENNIPVYSFKIVLPGIGMNSY